MPQSQPLTPKMQAIAQTLANHIVAARQTAANAETQFSDYLDQCAVQLGIDPVTVIFDAPTARFIPKPITPA